MVLPGGQGVEVLTQLKKLRPDAPVIPLAGSRPPLQPGEIAPDFRSSTSSWIERRGALDLDGEPLTGGHLAVRPLPIDDEILAAVRAAGC